MSLSYIILLIACIVAFYGSFNPPRPAINYLLFVVGIVILTALVGYGPQLAILR